MEPGIPNPKSNSASPTQDQEKSGSESTDQASTPRRSQTARASSAAEMRYRELVENANDIVFTLDFAGNMTSVNKAVERITGLGPLGEARFRTDHFDGRLSRSLTSGGEAVPRLHRYLG